MKYKLLITGLLLMIVSLNLTGCKHDKPEEEIITEEQNTNDTLEKSLIVKFGTENPWTAQMIIGNMNGNLLYLYAYPTCTSTNLPCLSMQIKPTIGTWDIDGEDFNPMLNPNARQYIEYYHDQAITIEGLTYGDWWVKSGTITITEFDEARLTITGTLNLIMFNADERYIQLNDHFNDVALSIIMDHVKVTPLRKQ